MQERGSRDELGTQRKARKAEGGAGRAKVKWLTLIPGFERDELARICLYKRFGEMHQGDPRFREAFKEDPWGALQRHHLALSRDQAEDLAFWVSNPASPPGGSEHEIVGLSEKYRKAMRNSTFMEKVEACANPRYKAWRERQIARINSQMRKGYSDEIRHIVTAFELTKGCSMHCWFCSLAAPRLSGVFSYTRANARLWADVLGVVEEILGPAGGAGICYYGTEPMDNPDYEKFCLDFHRQFGFFPQTTTAAPLRNPDRTRALNRLAYEKGCMVNRFSVLSLSMLRRIHATFSPEDLINAYLFLMYDLHTCGMSRAGRARQKAENDTELAGRLTAEYSPACLSGFMFNMVDCSVRLIAPCPPSEPWPEGQRIFDAATFSSAKDLKSIMLQMIGKHMPLSVPSSDPVRFRDDLKYKPIPDGFEVATRYMTRTFRGGRSMSLLGEMVQEGARTAGQIAAVLECCCVPPSTTSEMLDLLLTSAVLDDGT